MTIWPKIAELKYSDKNVNVCVVVRCQLVNFKQFKCVHCKRIDGPAKHLIDIMEGISNSQKYILWKKTGLYLPEEHANSRGEALCPFCKEALYPFNRPKIKLVVNYVHPFIDIVKLLNTVTDLHWKNPVTGMKYKGTTAVCYPIYVSKIEEIKLGIQKKCKGNVTLKLFEVSTEVLEKALELSTTRKLCKLL